MKNVIDEFGLLIETSYFGNQIISSKVDCIVNISVNPPHWFPGQYINFDPCIPHIHTVGTWYRSLKDDAAKYSYITEYFNTKLKLLSPNEWKLKLIDLCTQIKQEYDDHTLVVLTCYESPGQFCHRLVFSVFIKLILEVEILEFSNPMILDSDEAKFIERVLRTLIKSNGYANIKDPIR